MSTTGWIVLGVIVVFVLWIIMIYNQLVAMRQRVGQAFADVDVQLKQRHDLIPNLVETVKGFTKEESGVYGEIARARDGLMNAQTPEQKIAANGQLDGALAKFLVLTENYPQLRSSDQFMRLQDELAGTENRIAVARRRYNQAIEDYNVYIQQFPNSIWANMAGFKPKDKYYSADASSHEAPKVDFSK